MRISASLLSSWRRWISVAATCSSSARMRAAASSNAWLSLRRSSAIESFSVGEPLLGLGGLALFRPYRIELLIALLEKMQGWRGSRPWRPDVASAPVRAPTPTPIQPRPPRSFATRTPSGRGLSSALSLAPGDVEEPHKAQTEPDRGELGQHEAIPSAATRSPRSRPARSRYPQRSITRDDRDARTASSSPGKSAPSA